MREFFILITLFLFFLQLNTQAQLSNFQAPVSINEDGSDPDKNAVLDIQSSNKACSFPVCLIAILSNSIIRLRV